MGGQVLVRKDRGAVAFCQRLRGLGYDVLAVGSAAELHGLLADGSAHPRALLLATDLPPRELASALAVAGPALRDGRLTGLATGPRPAPDAIHQLARANVTLWVAPGGDEQALRFQINRAFLDGRAPGPARRELRAPLPWRVTVHVGERSKQARLYNLSPGGAYLATPRPSPRGARIEVALALSGGAVRLPARVIHTHVPGNLASPRAPRGMGIRFEYVSPEQRAWLATQVAERSRALVL